MVGQAYNAASGADLEATSLWWHRNHMNPDRVARLRYLIAFWFAGGIALAAVTWACFQLGLNGATTQ